MHVRGQPFISLSQWVFALRREVYLLFGRESRGIDDEVLQAHADECVRIPMRSGLRSLNLSNACALGVYEVLRQNNFEGLDEEGRG